MRVTADADEPFVSQPWSLQTSPSTLRSEDQTLSHPYERHPRSQQQMTGAPSLPGPRMPAPVQSILYATSRTQFLEHCRRRYGDDFSLRLMALPPVAYLSSRDSVARLFKAPPDDARAGEANLPGAAIVGPGSLLLLDGSRHLTERKLLLPSFHGNSVQAFTDVVRDATAHALSSWPTGQPLALWPRMQAITLEVILRAIFGIRDPVRFARLRELLPTTINVSPLLLLQPRLRLNLGRLNSWGRMLGARSAVDELLFEEIARRRKQPAEPPQSDVLSLLLSTTHDDGSALTDAELRDELMTLVLAGHETTATALAWAFERLARHPEAWQHLRRDDSGQYVDAVINETLRVRPIVSAVARILHEPLALAECTLPAGTLAMAGIDLVHTASDAYPDANDFRPERFLGEQPVERYAWIPFGGGTRRCLGAALAVAEMRIVLSAVVRQFDLEPTSKAPERPHARAVVNGPQHGCEVRLTRRQEPTPTNPVVPAASLGSS
jgi:cytochrome P450